MVLVLKKNAYLPLFSNLEYPHCGSLAKTIASSCLLFSRISSVQFSHSVVSDSATPWTAARQASLSITSSQSLLKLMSIESVMLSNPLILCHPPLLLPSILPSIRVFPNGSAPHIRWPKYSASASVLPMNTQDWSPLGWTGLISLQSKGLSRVFSNTTVQKHQLFGAQLSLWSSSHICAVRKLPYQPGAPSLGPGLPGARQDVQSLGCECPGGSHSSAWRHTWVSTPGTCFRLFGSVLLYWFKKPLS